MKIKITRTWCVLFLVDGNWCSWTESVCSKTCGIGQKNRSRTCNNPAPMYGGKPCAGESFKNMTCTEGPCPSTL